MTIEERVKLDSLADANLLMCEAIAIIAEIVAGQSKMTEAKRLYALARALRGKTPDTTEASPEPPSP